MDNFGISSNNNMSSNVDINTGSPASPQTNQIPQVESLNQLPGGAYARWASNILDNIYLGLIALPLLAVAELLLFGNLSINKETIDQLQNNIFIQILGIVVFFSYSVFFNVKKGATPGKSSYHLKIVKVGTMEYMGYGRAFARELLKTLSFFPLLGTLYFLINAVIIIFTKQKRTIYDLIVGTQVIKIQNDK